MQLNENLLIGIADADLLDGGTRHPNLALLKLAGFLSDNGVPFKLIESGDVDITEFDRIYVSKVFSFTKEPNFVERAKGTLNWSKIHLGGTGYYATISDDREFTSLRQLDMEQFENDEFLSSLPNHRGGKYMGIDMARQMPYYDLTILTLKNKLPLVKNVRITRIIYTIQLASLLEVVLENAPFVLIVWRNES